MDFGAPLQALLDKAIAFIPKLIFALLIFAAALLLSGVAARWARRAGRVKIQDEETLRLLSLLARWSVIILGTLMALDQVDFDVTGFAAGLGIAGLTVGFALQDIARNFIAGILLLVRQPFSIGDRVEIAGRTGTVLDVNSRDTVLKAYDGEVVIVPNLDVYTSPIVNYTHLPLMRRTVQIGLGYGEDVDQATQVFLAAIQGVEGVLDEPRVAIHAMELGDSALSLEARYWLNQEAHDVFAVHSTVVQAIKETAEQQAIDLPYPVQTVRLERVSA